MFPQLLQNNCHCLKGDKVSYFLFVWLVYRFNFLGPINNAKTFTTDCVVEQSEEGGFIGFLKNRQE